MSELRLSIILIVLLLIIGVLTGIRVMSRLSPEISPEGQIERKVIYQNTTLAPVSPILYPHTVVYGSLISCLSSYESQGNPKAFNPKDTDGYPKYGLLQFHKPTFQEFCVKKYNYRNDIWDEEIQRLCADRMIQEGYAGYWGTLKFCQ